MPQKKGEAVSQMERPTCGTCPYWDETHWGPKTGYCLRMPPQVQKGLDDLYFGVWPLTADGAGCGEHPEFPEYIRSLKDKV